MNCVSHDTNSLVDTAENIQMKGRYVCSMMFPWLDNVYPLRSIYVSSKVKLGLQTSPRGNRQFQKWLMLAMATVHGRRVELDPHPPDMSYFSASQSVFLVHREEELKYVPLMPPLTHSFEATTSSKTNNENDLT